MDWRDVLAVVGVLFMFGLCFGIISLPGGYQRKWKVTRVTPISGSVRFDSSGRPFDWNPETCQWEALPARETWVNGVHHFEHFRPWEVEP